MVLRAEELSHKIARLRAVWHGCAAAPRPLLVILDFDRTITTADSATSHGVLEMAPEFKEKQQEITKHYLPLERDPLIAPEQRELLMQEWWNKTHELMISSNTTRACVQRSIDSRRLKLRPGVSAFINLLSALHVPTLVFSAGLADIVECFLASEGIMLPNVTVVANRMHFEDGHDGRLVGFKDPLLTSVNKSISTLLSSHSSHDSAADESAVVLRCDLRAVKGVMLVGDNADDVHMADGLQSLVSGDLELLSVGILESDPSEARVARHAAAFDELFVCENFSFDAVTAIFNRIISDVDGGH